MYSKNSQACVRLDTIAAKKDMTWLQGRKTRKWLWDLVLGLKLKSKIFFFLLPAIKSKTVGSSNDVFVEDIIRKCEVFQEELS